MDKGLMSSSREGVSSKIGTSSQSVKWILIECSVLQERNMSSIRHVSVLKWMILEEVRVFDEEGILTIEDEVARGTTLKQSK